MPEFVQLHPGGVWHRPSPSADDFTVCGIPILERHAATHAAAMPVPACAHHECSTVPANAPPPRLDALRCHTITGNARPRSRT